MSDHPEYGPNTYALIRDLGGPRSVLWDCWGLGEAVEIATTADPTSWDPSSMATLEDELGYDASRDTDCQGLIRAAYLAGWDMARCSDEGDPVRWWVLAHIPDRGDAK